MDLSKHLKTSLTKPPDHLFNAPNEPLLLLLGVRVIVAEIGDSPMSPRVTKVEIDGLGVADVENSRCFLRSDKHNGQYHAKNRINHYSGTSE